MSKNERTIEKLPKWAQERISSLERTVHCLRTELSKQQCNTPSRIRWGYGFPDEATGFLDDHETIFFKLKDKPARYIRVRIGFKDENRLNINADGPLEIRCGSSNDFMVGFIEP